MVKNGQLFNWLEKIPPATRPIYIADITPALLTQWRATWKFADYTGAQQRYNMENCEPVIVPLGGRVCGYFSPSAESDTEHNSDCRATHTAYRTKNAPNNRLL